MYTGIKLDTSALQTPTLAQKLSLRQKTSPSSYEQAQAEAEKAEYERRMLEARRQAAQEQLAREKRIIAEQEAAQAEYERRMLQARQQAQREEDARQARQTQTDLVPEAAQDIYEITEARALAIPGQTGVYYLLAAVQGPGGCRGIILPPTEDTQRREAPIAAAHQALVSAAAASAEEFDLHGEIPFDLAVEVISESNPQAFFDLPACALPSDEELLAALGLGGAQQAPAQQAPAQQAPAQQAPSKLPAFLAVGAAAALMYIIGSMA